MTEDIEQCNRGRAKKLCAKKWFQDHIELAESARPATAAIRAVSVRLELEVPEAAC